MPLSLSLMTVRVSSCSRALAVQVDESMRRAVLVDVLTVYGATGKAIIFTKTKRAADEVAAGVALTIPCEVSLKDATVSNDSCHQT